MHWTVNPGRYCIIPPGADVASDGPLVTQNSQKFNLFARKFALICLRCQQKTPQYVVVALRDVENGDAAGLDLQAQPAEFFRYGFAGASVPVDAPGTAAPAAGFAGAGGT
jgi:hypothetical protein